MTRRAIMRGTLMRRALFFALLIVAAFSAPAREVAITIDDLPRGGDRGSQDLGGLRRILEVRLAAGADLGNHSRSHWDINDTSLQECTADIINGEPVLREVLAAHGEKLEFYRHPFLHREPPQILLIHASQMNADMMPELLAMFRRRGYSFISLDRALADPPSWVLTISKNLS
jgi:peptidoglycan/xylan/chitin deacetylase (PgdA/CDA1 family)